jgi:uncharacterized protein YecT (DUF1311 family)
MTIHVTDETCQKVVGEVAAYRSRASARRAQHAWLREHDIRSRQQREAKSQHGTEFIVRECELKP